MKAAEIRELDSQELVAKLEDLKKELFNLKFQKVMGMLESTANIRKVKRDIARFNTVRNEKNVQ